MRKRGIQILDLAESNPTRAGIRYPKGILSAFTNPKNLKYEPDPKGSLAARQVIVRYYREKGARLDPEQIILTASTSEAYSHLFRLLADPGDEVLIPEPGYPLFEYLASLSDVRTRPYPLAYDGRWHLEPAGLERGPTTRAICLVHPNNPTGNYVKRTELEKLNDGKLPLISDEVFLDYALTEDSRRVPTLAGRGESLTFTLSGISKILGLPQMKLAWIVVSGPPKARREVIAKLEIIADTYLSVGTPVQNALTKWLGERAGIQRQIQERIQNNLKAIHPPASCELLRVEGGWYAVLRIPRTRSEEEWTMEFLERDHVQVQPGYFFDFPSEAYLVVSLLTPTKIFEEGLERIFARIERES